MMYFITFAADIINLFNLRKMKKAFILMFAMWFLLAVSGFAESLDAGVRLAAVVNPNNWGLDSVITQIVAALASFIVGFFVKSPQERKKDKEDFDN